ncbi:MAG: division/cell wall cluster transcriptional repressor MraZ [Clostridia bacterium]|nr:division/cell wall cluster transcriptional repressor MraZ [Clostridia bacterium]
MLLGEYRYNVDAKGRLFIPARLRDETGDNLVVTRSLDKCINVYSVRAWQSFVEKTVSLPEISARELKRFIFSSALEITADSMGRIVLPQKLRDTAGITRSVVIIGVDNHAEIWSEEEYAKYEESRDTEALLKLIADYSF